MTTAATATTTTTKPTRYVGIADAQKILGATAYEVMKRALCGDVRTQVRGNSQRTILFAEADLERIAEGGVE